MVPDQKLTNAVAGKTARACDSCIRKRARWYCAADDAFLCQNCDASVHSANPLALRHQRIPLKTSSSLKSNKISHFKPLSMPSWHRGFTRKPRTKRFKKHGKFENQNPLGIIVPQVFNDDDSHGENDEQFSCKVPSFDLSGYELSNDEEKNGNEQMDSELFHGFLPSEMDLEEFATDVESLLGKGNVDYESFDLEGLGFMDDCQVDSSSFGREEMKNKENEVEFVGANNQGHDGKIIDVRTETFEFNLYGCSSPRLLLEEGTIDNKIMAQRERKYCENYSGRSKIWLRLDYDSIITDWDEQRSPWANGERPQKDSYDDQCWPYCMGTCGRIHDYGDVAKAGHTRRKNINVGREERVSRYREKRRTRLFSKKIRYEVRKMNAEKRPRFKGRFVKRSIFGAPTAYPLLNK